MRLLLVLVFALGCQVDESDNYYRHEYPPGTSFDWPILGNWNHPNGILKLDSQVSCDYDTVKADVIIEQKYMQLEFTACGLPVITAWRSLPPYDSLSLLIDSKWTELWRL